VLKVQRDVNRVVRSLEGRTAEGLPLGSVAPPLRGDVLLIDGQKRTSTEEMAITEYNYPTVIWFMAAGCQPCLGNRTAINVLSAEYQGRAHMIVNCVGDSAAVAYYAEELRGPVTIVQDSKRTNAQEWRVFISPFAVVVDGNGIIKRKIATVTAEQVQLALDSFTNGGGMLQQDRHHLAT
jgi:hypothetical protein